MNSKFQSLRVSNASRVIITTQQLINAEGKLSFKLPDSYKAFVQEYGYGLLLGMFRIYLPEAYHACEDLSEVIKDLSADIQWAEKEKFIRYQPDGSSELVARLIPFGKDDGGGILAWDLRDEPERGEYRIYVIGSRFSSVHKAAGSLYEFIERALRPDLDGMVGRIEVQLEAKFEPAVIKP